VRKLFGILGLTASLALAGCTGSGITTASGRNPVPAAVNGDTKPAATDGGGKPAALAPGVISPQNTRITFVGTKPGDKHNGGFKAFSGSIKPIDGDITKSTITVEIDTDSLWTDEPSQKLTRHLKSPDFFDVQKYPKASFVSKEIRAEAKDGNTHVITGDLTLHGTTKPITIPARLKETTAGDALTIDGTFTIDRTQFGIAFNKAPVDNTVTIKVTGSVARK
jgi:polyisoprenoid-binding protein YceI